MWHSTAPISRAFQKQTGKISRSKNKLNVVTACVEPMSELKPTVLDPVPPQSDLVFSQLWTCREWARQIFFFYEFESKVCFRECFEAVERPPARCPEGVGPVVVEDTNSNLHLIPIHRHHLHQVLAGLGGPRLMGSPAQGPDGPVRHPRASPAPYPDFPAGSTAPRLFPCTNPHPHPGLTTHLPRLRGHPSTTIRLSNGKWPVRFLRGYLWNLRRTRRAEWRQQI